MPGFTSPALAPGLRRPEKLISVQGPLEISGNFFSTGELPGAEQSLVVKTETAWW